MMQINTKTEYCIFNESNDDKSLKGLIFTINENLQELEIGICGENGEEATMHVCGNQSEEFLKSMKRMLDACNLKKKWEIK